MKKENLIASLVIIGALLVSGSVFALENPKEEIKFPVAELGGCKSEASCKVFCDKKENIEKCVDFAAKNEMMTEEEAAQAKIFAKLGEGPGGCKDQTSCVAYCDDLANIDLCLSFAEKANFISSEELTQAKKVAAALAAGATLPAGCKSKAECEKVCAGGDNLTECLDFAKKAGFLTGEELAQAKKFAPLVASGETPGKCKNKEECENYCKIEANMDECFNFAEKYGMVSKEEAEMFRKTGGVGPGGCRSKDSCEAFCNVPENGEVCFKYAEDKGLIPPEKLKEAKEGMAKMQEGLKIAPPETLQCLKDKLGADNFARAEAGTFIPGPSAGGAIKECFLALQKMAEEKMGQIPPEAWLCIKGALGETAEADMKNGKIPPGQIQSTIEICMKDVIKGKIESEIENKIRENMPSDLPSGISVGGMATDVKACMVEVFGADYGDKMASGEIKQEQVSSSVGECVKKKVMEKVKANIPSGGAPSNLPPEAKEMMEGGGSAPKPPSAEELQKIQQEMEAKYRPQGIPEGYGPTPGSIPSGYGPQY